MTQTLTGLFDRYDDARRAVQDLEAAGVPHRDISLVANNSRGDNVVNGEHTANAGGRRRRQGRGLRRNPGRRWRSIGRARPVGHPGAWPGSGGWLASLYRGRRDRRRSGRRRGWWPGRCADPRRRAGTGCACLCRRRASGWDSRHSQGAGRPGLHRPGGPQRPEHRRSRRPARPLPHPGLDALRRFSPRLLGRPDRRRTPAASRLTSQPTQGTIP